MNVDRNLISCYRPLRLADGRLVNCGKCKACLVNKSKSINAKGNVELARQNIYALFILLTYDDAHLPYNYVSVDSNYEGYFGISFCDSDGVYIAQSVIRTPQYKQLETINSIYDGKFPVLSKPHLQKFLKNIRTNVCRSFKRQCNIRYMACGEFGPTNFRPHYHVILFFETQAERAFARHYILKGLDDKRYKSSSYSRKPWKFGFCNAKYFERGGTGYVTSYLVSSLSSFALHRVISPPFFLHSNYFGQVAFKAGSDFSTFCKDSFLLSTYDFEHTSKLLPYTDEYKVNSANLLLYTLFPRCRQFGTIDSQLFSARYEFAVRYDITECAKAARSIINSYESGKNNFLCQKYLEVFGYPPSLSQVDLDCQKYRSFLFNRIYSDIKCSVDFANLKRYLSSLVGFHLSTFTIISKVRDMLGKLNYYKQLQDYNYIINFNLSSNEIKTFYRFYYQDSSGIAPISIESTRFYEERFRQDFEYISRRDKSKRIKEKYLKH